MVFLQYVYNKDYKILKLNAKRFDKAVLLTNDRGNFCVLSNQDYDKLIFKNLDEKLFKKLEDNFMILTDSNFSEYSDRFNKFNWSLGKAADLHIIVPTLRCNFTCKYCFAKRECEDNTSTDMAEETMDKTIDFIFSVPSRSCYLEFTGGEPLIRFDLVRRAVLKSKNLAKTMNKKVSFSIVSNGTLLNDEIIDFLIENDVNLCISIDGNKEIHDSNRKFTRNLSSSSYDSIISSIKKLKAKDFDNLAYIPVILKDSLKYYKEIVDEYINLGARTLRFKYVSRFGFASDAWKSMSYSAEEFLDSWKKTINYMLLKNDEGIKIKEDFAVIILRKLLSGKNERYTELMNPCGAVYSQLSYNYDGNIFTCDEARTVDEFNIGNVFTSKYSDLAEHPVSKSLQSSSNLTAYNCDSGCPWFSFCGICPLEIYLERNSGFITNINSNYRHKLHLGMFEFIMEKLLDEDIREKLISWVYPEKIPESVLDKLKF